MTIRSRPVPRGTASDVPRRYNRRVRETDVDSVPARSDPAVPARLAATPARAATLAGASLRQVDYWRKTALVSPALSRRLGARSEVRLYSLAELVELRVVAALRRRSLSLQHIRKVVAHLRRHYDAPLRELRFAVEGSDLYVQHHDGSWEGGLRPDQLVLQEVIPLEIVRTSLARALQEARGEEDEGKIARRRGVRGSQPVFAGTRVPVSAVQAFVARGASDERILQAYPELSEKDIQAARTAIAG